MNNNEILYILKDTTDPNFPRESRSWIVTNRQKTINRIYNATLISGNISVNLGDCVYIEDEDDNSLILIAYKMSDDLSVHAGHKYTFVHISTYDVLREVTIFRMPQKYHNRYRIELEKSEFGTDCRHFELTVNVSPTKFVGIDADISYIENGQTIIHIMDTDGDEWILKPTGRVTLCPFMKL